MDDFVDRIALRDALYKEDAITMEGLKIINQFPSSGRKEENSATLTLEELKSMDGEPVWFETDYEDDKGWHICHGEYKGRYIACDGGSCYDFGVFTEGCIVPYRHPPKED